MPGPYDYISPLGGFQNPMEAFVNAIKLQDAAAQERAARDRKARLSAAFNRLGPNAAYADYIAEVRANPDLSEDLLGRRKMYSDATQGALQDVGQRAFMLLRPDASGTIDPTAASDFLSGESQRFANAGEDELAQTLGGLSTSIKGAPGGARNLIGMMLAFSDPDKFKKVMDATGGGEPLDKGYELDVALFGPEQAKAFRAGKRAAEGTVSTSGPAGTVVTPALRVNPMIAAQASASSQPVTAPAETGPILTYEQASGMVNGLGVNGASEMLKRNNYRVRVNTPDEARRLPSGTKIVLPDGSPGVVP